MNKKIRNIYLLIFLLLFNFNYVEAATVSSSLKGKILLQVESKGEAWYVNPKNSLRYYLGRPDDAFKVMRGLGIGIKNSDLQKIPGDRIFTQNNLGKIFLQIESHGEAWYVNPSDRQKYYLGRPQDAFQIMRQRGLGITNADLNLISVGNLESENSQTNTSANSSTNMVAGRYSVSAMEKEIFDLVNVERKKAGLQELAWNEEIATVAREHSQNLARDNISMTSQSLSCDFPFIHHEGLDFGLFQHNRLNNRNIWYFSQSGENIALVPVARRFVSYDMNEKALVQKLDTCPERQSEFNNAIKLKTENKALTENARIELIKSEIKNRQTALKNEFPVTTNRTEWTSQSETDISTVNGWMDSPGHKANILKDSFNEAGMGIAYVNGYFIATQVFIKRVECGYKGSTCCEKTDYFYCFNPYSCKNNICQ